MSTYESDRDAAAEEFEPTPASMMLRSESLKEAFKAGANWATERANVRERRYMDIDGENIFLNQQLEAAKAEIEQLHLVVSNGEAYAAEKLTEARAEIEQLNGLLTANDELLSAMIIETNQMQIVMEQMAEALKQYADKARWSARKIPLGNGQSASAPGLFFGPNIAIEALAAHKNWSAK